MKNDTETADSGLWSAKGRLILTGSCSTLSKAEPLCISGKAYIKNGGHTPYLVVGGDLADLLNDPGLFNRLITKDKIVLAL